MDYRIAICDDRQEDREYVRQLTARWAQQRGNQVEMTEFCSAEQFLFSCPQPDFDLLLLDIEMGEMDGVSLAKQVRRTNELMQIVFITGYSDYITEGYEVAALHYLMKPVKEEKLFVVLDLPLEAVLLFFFFGGHSGVCRHLQPLRLVIRHIDKHLRHGSYYSSCRCCHYDSSFFLFHPTLFPGCPLS